jgi:hypothetical protein
LTLRRFFPLFAELLSLPLLSAWPLLLPVEVVFCGVVDFVVPLWLLLLPIPPPVVPFNPFSTLSAVTLMPVPLDPLGAVFCVSVMNGKVKLRS